MANRQPTTPTPGQLLSRPQPQWQPLTAQGQLNADFIMEMSIWQERGIAPGLVYTPPPPPPRLPPPPPQPQQPPHYAAPPLAPAHQSAVAGYTSAPPTAPRPVRRTRVESSPRKPAAPAPASGKPYGTRSRTVAHPVRTLSLPAAQSILAETFNRDPQRAVCPLAGCERACASPAALQQHVLGSHVGAVHACARCTKIFKTAAGLADHRCSGRHH